jgi:hypothetical protein
LESTVIYLVAAFNRSQNNLIELQIDLIALQTTIKLKLLSKINRKWGKKKGGT